MVNKRKLQVVHSSRGKLHYLRLPDEFDKGEKLGFLAAQHLGGVEWRRLNPNAKHTWLVSDTEAEFESFLPIGSKHAKRASTTEESTIFRQFSSGVKTNRDMVVMDFGKFNLLQRMDQFVRDYHTQVFHYKLAIEGKKKDDWPNVDNFVDYSIVKWDGTLKGHLRRGKTSTIDNTNVRKALYRPFVAKSIYFDAVYINSVYRQPYYFPNTQSEAENQVISLTDKGSERPFMVMMSQFIPDLHIVGPGCSAQCFPYYTYDRDGSNRRENITDFARTVFRKRYSDRRISKWDIFHYVYALLHHPTYRKRYAPDLKRSLPHIPFAPEFRAFARAGRQLAELHLNYETADRYSLEWERTAEQIDFRVQKMLPRRKQTSQYGKFKWFDSLKYNDSLTLRGIPERAFLYQLGTRSALEWIVDQYRVKHDKRSGITHDPNDYSSNARYIVDLFSRVITVSLKTVDVVDELKGLEFR